MCPPGSDEDRRGSLGAIWLTREASEAGDPSLRLKNGFAQDDNFEKKFELGNHLKAKSLKGS
jgi:hypothetical protein